MNTFPPPPIFGVTGCGDGNGGSLGSKYINLDEIFDECFPGPDGSDLLNLERPTGGGVNAGEEGVVGGDGGSVTTNASAGCIGNGASGGINAGAFPETGATPALMPTQTHEQQQQLGASPLGGISMYLGGDGVNGGGGVTPQAVVTGQQSLGTGAGVKGTGIPKVSPTTASTAAVAASRGGRGGASGGRRFGFGSDRGAGTGAGGIFCSRSASTTSTGLEEDDDKERVVRRSAGGMAGGMAGGKRPRQGGRNMTEQQKLDRRERNREHAKRSRVRKKFLLESLQKSVTALQEENEKLRGAIRANLGADEAKELLSQTDTSSLISSSPGDATKVLDDPDYSLVKALQTAQQNFVITDPTLPDNPIVFASQGFLELTGYSLDEVLGRNCRFLQGPDTDPKAVEKIRKAIEKGVDTSVCLRNYRVDGAMFWNQFFIAALRDSEGTVINYVGVQCRVDEDFVRAAQKREGDADGDEEEDDEEDGDDDRSDAEDKDALAC